MRDRMCDCKTEAARNYEKSEAEFRVVTRIRTDLLAGLDAPSSYKHCGPCADPSFAETRRDSHTMK
jgi:hypothetical protein